MNEFDSARDIEVDDNPLFIMPSPSVAKVSKTTDLVNQGREYLIQNLQNINESRAFQENEAIGNRLEYYNPDTKEERKVELNQEFFNKYDLASRVDAEYAIFKERRKGTQSAINTARALIARERENNEKNKADPFTYEGALYEQGISTDSDLTRGIFSPVTNALDAFSIREFGGEDPISLLLNTVLRGGSVEDIREKFKNASPEEQRAYVESLTNSIVTDGNILTPDYASKLEVLEKIVQDNYTTGEKLFDNTLSILDSIGALQTVKGVVKGASNAVRGASTLSKAEKANDILTGLRGVSKQDDFIAKGDSLVRARDINVVTQDNPLGLPKDGSQKAINDVLARQALNSDGEQKEVYTKMVESATGQTPEQVIASNNLPTLNDPSVPLDKESILNVVRDYSSENITESSKIKLIEDIEKNFAKRAASNIDIDVEGPFLSIKTTLGSQEGKAFSSYSEAKAAIDNIIKDINEIGLRAPEFKVVGELEGEILDISKVSDYSNIDNFYLQLNHNSDISFRMKNAEAEAADIVSSVFDSHPITRGMARNTLTNSAILPSDFIRPLMSGLEYGRGLAQKVFKSDFNEINNAIKALSNSDKQKILDTIIKGNISKKKFTPAELRSAGHTQKQIDAIYSVYNAHEKEWVLKNLLNARRLNKRGFRSLMVDDTRYYGRAVNNLEPSASVYDLNSKSLMKLSDYKTKPYVYEMANPIEHEGTVYRYAASINEPQTSVINPYFDDTIGKIEGYVEMRLKPNQVFLDLDGKTIGVAKTRLDAYERAKSIASSKGRDISDFKIRYSKESSGPTEGLREADLSVPREGIQFINQSAMDAIIDPFDSIRSGISKTIEDIQLEPIMDVAKRDFMTLYGDMVRNLDGTVSGSFPQYIDQIKGAGREANRARKMFEYIRTIEKNTFNEIDDLFKQQINTYAEIIGEKAVENGGFMANVYAKGEKALLAASRANPLQSARQATSIAYIVQHPLRQSLLQATQALNIVGIDPLGVVNGDFVRIAGEGLFGVSGLKANVSSKVAPFVDIIDRIGLFNNQSTVGFVEEALRLQKGGALKKALIDYPALGAIYGEKFQQYCSAAALYSKYVRDNGIEWFSKKRNVDQFVEQLRIITGSQSKVEQFAYERNYFSLLMQFVQTPHKMMSMLFNKEIPAAMRTRIALTEAVFFGSGYYGYNAIHKLVGGIEDADLSQAIERGIFGLTVNKLFGTVMQTENFSPTDFNGVIRGLIEWTSGDKTLWENFSIPAVGLAQHRIAPVIKDFLAISGIIDNPDGKTLSDAVLDIGKISSGVAAAQRAYIAYTTGNYYNSKGEVIKSGLDGKQSFGILLGFQPETYKNVEWDMRKALMEDRKGQTEEMLKAYDAALTQVNDMFPPKSERTSVDEINRATRALSIMAASFVGNDPNKAVTLRRFTNNKLREIINGKDNNMAWFYRSQMKNLNGMTDDMEIAMTRLRSIDPDRARQIDSMLLDLKAPYQYGDYDGGE